MENICPASGFPRRVQHPISVPFMWEVRPGIPKKDWACPTAAPPPVSSPPPAKFVVSVPFLWETEPGKPFSRTPSESFGLLPSMRNDNNIQRGGNPFVDDEDEEVFAGLVEFGTLAPEMKDTDTNSVHLKLSSSASDNGGDGAAAAEFSDALEFLFPSPKIRGCKDGPHEQDGFEMVARNELNWEKSGGGTNAVVTLGELIKLTGNMSLHIPLFTLPSSLAHFAEDDQEESRFMLLAMRKLR